MRLAVRNVLFACTLASAHAHAADTNAPPGDAQHGKKVFLEQLCQACHGTAGQGGERGAGPHIAPNTWPYAAFANQVRKPRQSMPPYSANVLSEADLRDIHAYLSAITPGPAAKDLPLLSGF